MVGIYIYIYYNHIIYYILGIQTCKYIYIYLHVRIYEDLVLVVVSFPSRRSHGKCVSTFPCQCLQIAPVWSLQPCTWGPMPSHLHCNRNKSKNQPKIMATSTYPNTSPKQDSNVPRTAITVVLLSADVSIKKRIQSMARAFSGCFSTRQWGK